MKRADPAVKIERMRWWHIAELLPIEADLFGPERWSAGMFWNELANGHYYRVALDGVAVVGYAGLAFAAPIQPGKTDAGRAWAREAFVTRKAELDESRRRLKSTREDVFVNQTPQGDVAVVYVEAEDPIEANRQFAASGHPYDRWFKDRLKDIFPPQIDFDQPVPANEQFWDWSR